MPPKPPKKTFTIADEQTLLKLAVLKQYLGLQTDDAVIKHALEMAFKRSFPRGIKQ